MYYMSSLSAIPQFRHFLTRHTGMVKRCLPFGESSYERNHHRLRAKHFGLLVFVHNDAKLVNQPGVLNEQQLAIMHTI